MKVDMKKYLASHDLVYKSAPKLWQDALVCGNGHLGALFFAPFFPEFLINKADIWDYETVRGKLAKHKDVMKALKEGKELNDIVASTGFAAAKISSPKTGAKLRLRFGKDDNWTGGYKTSGRLSIYDGVLHASMDRHLSHPRLESFVHSGKNLFCLRAKGVSALVDGSVKMELMRPADYAYDPPKFGNERDVIWMKMSLPENFHYVVAAKAVPQGSAAYMDYMKKHYRTKHQKPPVKTVSTSIEPNRASLTAAGEFEFFVSVVTSKDSKSPLKDAVKLVTAAGAAGYGSLYKEHVKWWEGFWKKSFINLSDKILEQIWYTSVYVQASQYRTSPVPGLQGLWFGGTGIEGSQQLQWWGNYTNDQNTEIVPMPFFTANRLDLIEPFYDTFNAIIPQAKKDTKEVFGMRGVHFPLNCGPDGKTYQHGEYGYIHCGGPYHGLIYCWGWEYFKDKKLLKEKIYPFIKEICNFFADYMTFDEETQKYRLYPSQPPEVPFLDVGNPTHTLSLLKVNLKTAVEEGNIGS